MPELPECETIHRQLLRELIPTIGGPTIHQAVDYWDLSIDWNQLFCGTSAGSRIKTMARKGKSFLWQCDDFNVYLHLKMSGRLTILRSMAQTNNDILSAFKHVKAIFSFKHRTSGSVFEDFKVVYTDTRGFGLCEIRPGDKANSKIEKLGPDPLYPNEWTIDKFIDSVTSVGNKPIASALLDQEVVAGIGNIYRSEILRAAHIYPFRQVKTLSHNELLTIYSRTSDILGAAIQARGTSMKDYRSSYRDLYGNMGEYQHQLTAYQRETENCLTMGCSGVVAMSDLEKNRRVYWCSDCQV